MWTLISRINMKRTRVRLGRVVVAAAVVVGAATEVAVALLPKPVASAAGPVLLDTAAVNVVETAPAEDLPALASAGRAMVSL